MTENVLQNNIRHQIWKPQRMPSRISAKQQQQQQLNPGKSFSNQIKSMIEKTTLSEDRVKKILSIEEEIQKLYPSSQKPCKQRLDERADVKD